MKNLIAVIVFMASLVLSVYLGINVFIFGVVNIADGVKADPTNGAQVAWGVVQAGLLAELVLSAGIWIGALLAVAISKPKARAKRPTAKQTERIWKSRIGDWN